MQNIDVLLVVYNRPAYTAATLDSLGNGAEFRLWVWQNGNDPEVARLVHASREKGRIHRHHHSQENVGLREPTNWFWRESTAALVGKLDDDCIMPTGWCERLAAIHADAPKAGILGCWPFREEDIRPELVDRKAVTLGGHRIMQNPWVGGAGYLMKRACLDRCGLLREDEGFTSYCMRVARAGWTIGWPIPFLVMDHMDDPRSDHTVFKTDQDVVVHRGITAKRRGIETLEQLRSRVEAAALELQTCSPHWRDHVGWRVKFRRALGRIGR